MNSRITAIRIRSSPLAHIATLVVGCLLAGCSTNGEVGLDASSSGSGSTTPTTANLDTSTTRGEGTTSGSSSTDANLSSDFIVDPDGGTTTRECDVLRQDCPAGEKCMPWAHDGGNSWNATKCSAIAPDPDRVDEPCTVEDSRVSGVDSCEFRTVCWHVDPATGLGICVPFCIGNTSPHCEDPNRECTISSSDILLLCPPRCDPLAHECGPGAACHTFGGDTSCVPDTSGDQGAYGDPCEFISGCDPGLSCEDAAATPGCAGEDCCTLFCDVTEPNTCPGVGQECLPSNLLPFGLAHVGICAVPG